MDPLVMHFAFPGIKNIRIAFQTRRGGVSRGSYSEGNIGFNNGDPDENVRRNRELLQKQLGFQAWVETIQVHGSRTLFEPEPDNLQEADGLATSRPGQALVIKTADCQPLLVSHESGSCIAAFHVGWRGNESGFILQGVAEFSQRYGVLPSELWAVRGPSLGPAASEFVNFHQEWRPGFTEYFDQATQSVNLWRLTRDQLLAAGFRNERILSLDLCTWSLPDLFFSYRREKHCGRQANIIWIHPPLPY